MGRKLAREHLCSLILIDMVVWLVKKIICSLSPNTHLCDQCLHASLSSGGTDWVIHSHDDYKGEYGNTGRCAINKLSTHTLLCTGC